MTKEKSKEVAKYLFGIGASFMITGIVEISGYTEFSKYFYFIIGVLYMFLAAKYWK